MSGQIYTENNYSHESISMKIIRERQVKDLTGLSRVTRWRMERKGLFPKRIRLTEKCVGWSEAEVIEWLKERSEARNAE